MMIFTSTILRVCACTFAICAITKDSALAGFESWTTEVASDPFKGGEQVTVDYLQTIRSGVFIMCNTDVAGITVRAVPGWAYVAALEGLEPQMAIAIDGNVILEVVGTTGAVGDNIAMAEAHLSSEQSETFIKAFAASKKQIAIKDGISDAPFLLKARGSTKAGQRLEKCMAVNASKVAPTTSPANCDAVFDQAMKSSKAATPTGKAMEAADAVRKCKSQP